MSDTQRTDDVLDDDNYFNGSAFIALRRLCRQLERELNAMTARAEKAKAELAALREDKNRWENAVRSCVEWSNGRECEWGERAEHAFKFLHYAIDAARKEASE